MKILRDATTSRFPRNT